MEIIRGPVATAQKVVIYGPEGIGKTTLAAQTPNPLFIDTEGSTRHYDVARFPQPTSWTMLMQQVQHVIDNPDICDTLVIDTADWAEKLAVDHILARDQKPSIESYGYGKGYVYLEEEFGRLLNKLNDVVERGIHVVLVAHAQVRKFEQPGEAGAYDKWELKLLKRNSPLVKEWADAVLFCSYQTYVVNVDGQGVRKGRNIAEGGKRVIYTTHNPVWDAKNRHGLPPEVDMEYQHIARIFTPRGQLAGVAPVTTTVAAVAPPPVPEAPAPVETKSFVAPPDPFGEQEPETEIAPVAPAGPDGESRAESAPAPSDDLEAEGVPKALADLMRLNNVTLDELMDAVYYRGYFPRGTPFRNLPEDFVQGALIGAWPKVLEVIETNVRTPF